MSLKYNISYEVASIIFLILLLFYIRLQYDTSSRLNKEFRKLTWIGLIANVLDVQVIGNGSILRTAVIFFYLSNEGISLLENAGHLGLPIPEKLKKVLEQLHDRSEEDKDGE